MQNQQAAQESPLTVAQLGPVTILLILLAAIVLLAALTLVVYRARQRRNVPSTSVPSTSAPSTSVLTQGVRPWRDYGSLIVVICGIGAVIIGFLSVLFVVGSFQDVNQALGFLTAFFGAIVGLAGTYFGIKTSSDATEGAQRLAAANGRDTTEPQVTSFTPPDNDKNVSLKTRPTATFSKDMDKVTINESTFKLVAFGGDQAAVEPVSPKVPGGVQYNEATKVATFTPADETLQYGKRYGATITSGVRDKAGNSLAQDKVWHFTTQEPPAEEERPAPAEEERQEQQRDR
jgi:hypothetical protein